MQDLRCISLHFYFKVLDADLFGGEGTEGYTAFTSEECIGTPKKTIDNITSLEGFNSTSEIIRKSIASQMGVTIDKVIAISRQEYKNNIEEE